MAMNRRDFLRAGLTTGSASMAMASLGGMTSMLTAMQSRAATNTDGYKALVCLFLYGGMDNHDTIIPYDQSSYSDWANIRSSLLNIYGGARGRDQLLPINPSNSEDYSGRQFALPAEMSGLQGLFESGQAAVVGNVGPLIQPVTASSFEAETVDLPSRLFSHNDQQATWMSGAPEGAQYGWAGLFSDLSLGNGANSDTTFANITTGGGELLLTGTKTAPYSVGIDGAAQPEVLGENSDIRDLLTAHFRGAAYLPEPLLGQDINQKNRTAYDANAQYNQAAGGSALATEFPSSWLGQQLKAVAKTISARTALGANRQVFVVGLGGFDTHSEQAKTLPKLQSQIDQAVTAFHTAMGELSLNDDVALFTASDFGRTLAINGDGTDHGWGAHHFVVGGGVQGQRIFGDIPVSTLNHELDAGSGRLIPTTSVEQYAAALGRWYGLDDNELNIIFPNLTNFGSVPAIFA